MTLSPGPSLPALAVTNFVKSWAEAVWALYQAQDPVLNRVVAIKVLRPIPGAPTDDLERRFWREAQAIGRLNHPSIVQVYDAGVANDQWYLVMEYLAGKTLDRVVRQEGIQWAPLPQVIILARSHQHKSDVASLETDMTRQARQSRDHSQLLH